MSTSSLSTATTFAASADPNASTKSQAVDIRAVYEVDFDILDKLDSVQFEAFADDVLKHHRYHPAALPGLSPERQQELRDTPSREKRERLLKTWGYSTTSRDYFSRAEPQELRGRFDQIYQWWKSRSFEPLYHASYQGKGDLGVRNFLPDNDAQFFEKVSSADPMPSLVRGLFDLLNGTDFAFDPMTKEFKVVVEGGVRTTTIVEEKQIQRDILEADGSSFDDQGRMKLRGDGDLTPEEMDYFWQKRGVQGFSWEEQSAELERGMATRYRPLARNQLALAPQRAFVPTLSTLNLYAEGLYFEGMRLANSHLSPTHAGKIAFNAAMGVVTFPVNAGDAFVDGTVNYAGAVWTYYFGSETDRAERALRKDKEASNAENVQRGSYPSSHHEYENGERPLWYFVGDYWAESSAAEDYLRRVRALDQLETFIHEESRIAAPNYENNPNHWLYTQDLAQGIQALRVKADELETGDAAKAQAYREAADVLDNELPTLQLHEILIQEDGRLIADGLYDFIQGERPTGMFFGSGHERDWRVKNVLSGWNITGSQFNLTFAAVVSKMLSDVSFTGDETFNANMKQKARALHHDIVGGTHGGKVTDYLMSFLPSGKKAQEWSDADHLALPGRLLNVALAVYVAPRGVQVLKDVWGIKHWGLRSLGYYAYRGLGGVVPGSSLGTAAKEVAKSMINPIPPLNVGPLRNVGPRTAAVVKDINQNSLYGLNLQKYAPQSATVAEAGATINSSEAAAASLAPDAATVAGSAPQLATLSDAGATINSGEAVAALAPNVAAATAAEIAATVVPTLRWWEKPFAVAADWEVGLRGRMNPRLASLQERFTRPWFARAPMARIFEGPKQEITSDMLPKEVARIQRRNQRIDAYHESRQLTLGGSESFPWPYLVAGRRVALGFATWSGLNAVGVGQALVASNRITRGLAKGTRMIAEGGAWGALKLLEGTRLVIHYVAVGNPMARYAARGSAVVLGGAWRTLTWPSRRLRGLFPRSPRTTAPRSSTTPNSGLNGSQNLQPPSVLAQLASGIFYWWASEGFMKHRDTPRENRGNPLDLRPKVKKK